MSTLLECSLPLAKRDICVTMEARCSTENIVGVLLAGGSARRMGGCDKCLLPLDHRPILDHVIARAEPQVGQLLLSTNSSAALFSRYEIPVLHDTVPGFAGPLAGILAAMQWVRAQPDKRCHWLASFPTDSPFFPEDLVKQLLAAARDTDVELVYAASSQKSPLFALWSMEVMDDLAQQLERKERKVGNFIDRHRCAVLQFSGDSRDPFFNINTVEDLKAARELVGC